MTSKKTLRSLYYIFESIVVILCFLITIGLSIALILGDY